jgi:hypothetical protein
MGAHQLDHFHPSKAAYDCGLTPQANFGSKIQREPWGTVPALPDFLAGMTGSPASNRSGVFPALNPTI